MSLPILQSLASKYDLDIDEIERYWKEAKESLDTDDLSDKDYKYIYETVKDRVMKKVRYRFYVNEDTNTDTAKCPFCGTKYLVNTGYCVVCDKQVAKPKSEKKETKKERVRYTIPMNKRTRINRIVEGFENKYAKRKVF